MPFLQAVNEFRDFIEKHNISRIYAFGPADQFELRSSAKLNNADKDIFNIINQIKNIYPAFQSGLALHYAFSLSDICKICNVEHDIEGRAHNALFDAEDTGLAFFNMCKGLIDYDTLDSIDRHKYNVKLYRNSRNIKNATIKSIPEVNEEFIASINKVFDNAAGVIGEPIIRALKDDVMRLMGRPDLEIGEDGL